MEHVFPVAAAAARGASPEELADAAERNAFAVSRLKRSKGTGRDGVYVQEVEDGPQLHDAEEEPLSAMAPQKRKHVKSSDPTKWRVTRGTVEHMDWNSM